MFDWFRRRRRRQLASEPFPARWEKILGESFEFYARLDPSVREDFQQKLKIFLDEKPFFGARGQEIDDEVRVLIGASAVRLILFLDLAFYDNVREIVVYPDDYVHPEDGDVMLGEVYEFGSVLLSWIAVREGIDSPHDGTDTAIHEFAHMLDWANGEFDGIPPLRSAAEVARWERVVGTHLAGLQRNRRNERVVLREDGGDDESEFFAVATESFFEKPKVMRELLPDLFAILLGFYGYDPAGNPIRAGRSDSG
jgi:MtfA peptidase